MRLAGLLLLALLALTFAPARALATTIRVAIAKSPRLTVRGMDLVVRDAAGRPVPLPDAYTEVPIEVVGGRIAIGGRTVENEPLTIESRSVYFRIAGKQYRSVVSIHRDGDRLLAVNAIDLEDYLVGLINHEVSSAWSLEAVKAQAVVARTYAVYQAGSARDARYDLESTVDDQVYGGSQTEDWRSAKAVRDTAGEVLVDSEGNPIQAFYSSSCGGMTELPQNVWGMRTPITKSVKDPWCAKAPNASWTWSIDGEEMGRKLKAGGYGVGTVESVDVKRRTSADRALAIRITGAAGQTDIGGNELRRVLGYDKLKSTRFQVKEKDGTFTFSGRGAGHGVGLCQWGTKGMADAGYTYRQILGQYYPGLFLRNLEQVRAPSAARD